jgi:hypothetical protein
MASRFGHDFSQVRVHTDEHAQRSARDLSARAYTVGQNIFFGRGQFAPGTANGRLLLAHELAHVVQQGAARPQVAQRKPLPATRTNRAVIQRAVETACLAPSEIPLLSQLDASRAGSILEVPIWMDYCRQMGCRIFGTDYIDNVLPSSYVAFLMANNPHLTVADMLVLAGMQRLKLSRPDILSHRPPRFEYEEIKPDSVTGRADGRIKLAFLGPFYAHFRLPYLPGVTWVPTLEIPLFTLPGPVFAFLRVHRNAPGLVVYNICVRGEQSVLVAYGIAALLLAILIIILTRGRAVGGVPVGGGLPVPAFAMGRMPGRSAGLATTAGASTAAVQAKLDVSAPDDPLEREADRLAASAVSG